MTHAAAYQWERALTRHFLRADGPGGPAPLAFVDASPEELALAVGLPRRKAADALRDFLSVFNRTQLDDVLRYGVEPGMPDGAEGPGWFRHLMLTCVVASISPDIAGSGNFRFRLQELLGLPSPLSDLSALPKLWNDLHRWCNAKRDEGQPYRNLVLPDNLGRMTQIGHSVRIVFPSRHDLQRIVNLYTGFSSGPPRPKELIWRVRQDLDRYSWSQGFEAAFLDFERRYNRGERLIADHPFWAVIRKLAKADDEEETVETGVIATTDIDGFDGFVVTTTNPAVTRHLGRKMGASSDTDPVAINVGLDELLDVIAAAPRLGRDVGLRWLGRTKQEGVLAFGDEGWGAWRACRVPETSRVRLLIRPDVAQRYLGRAYAGWTLTEPLALGQVGDLLDAVCGRRLEVDEIRSFRLTGGIRIGSSFLGRPRFLPILDVDTECEVALERVRAERGDLSIDTSTSRLYPLMASEPSSGAWRLSIRERTAFTRSDILVTLIDRALEHDIKDIASLPATWQAEREIKTGEASPVLVDPVARNATGSPNPAILDLIEVLYAGGRTGWAEQDLVQVVATALNTEGPVVWDVIRLLQEAGWIEPRLSTLWRARRWFLRNARLLISECGTVGVLDGAACQIVRDRLEHACRDQGAWFVARSPSEGWSVPTYLVGGARTEYIASVAKLPVEPATVPLARPARAIEFIPSLHSVERREVGSSWDWRAGRFLRRGPGGDDPIALDRLIATGLNARDVYRIRRHGRDVALLESRAAAILLAHSLASQPLFRYRNAAGHIERISREGHLPLPVAQYLRLSSGCGAALVLDAGHGPGYVYPVSDIAVTDLVTWLGPCIMVEGRAAQPSGISERLKTIVLTRRGGRAAAVAAKLWR
jgi:hypothetical protein